MTSFFVFLSTHEQALDHATSQKQKKITLRSLKFMYIAIIKEGPMYFNVH